MYVTERMEIERGPEHYQMSMTELERFRNLEWEMQKYPQIQSLKEANLLLGTRGHLEFIRFGMIYREKTMHL